MARRAFIAIVGHGPDLEREEGAANALRALGAEVRLLDLWDEPRRLFADDADEDEAIARGWTVASMKSDWKTIFPPPGGVTD